MSKVSLNSDIHHVGAEDVEVVDMTSIRWLQIGDKFALYTDGNTRVEQLTILVEIAEKIKFQAEAALKELG